MSLVKHIILETHSLIHCDQAWKRVWVIATVYNLIFSFSLKTVILQILSVMDINVLDELLNDNLLVRTNYRRVLICTLFLLVVLVSE